MPAKTKQENRESSRKHNEKLKLYEKNIKKYEDTIIYIVENKEKKGIDIYFRDNSKIFLEIKNAHCHITNKYTQAKLFEIFLNSFSDRKEQIDFIFNIFLMKKERDHHLKKYKWY